MQGRNLQPRQSPLWISFTIAAKWQSLPGDMSHHFRYPSSRRWTNSFAAQRRDQVFRCSHLHPEKPLPWEGWQQENWLWIPRPRLLAAAFQQLCHLQLDWGPQQAPSTRVGWRQQQQVCRERAREIQCWAPAAGLQLLYTTSHCKFWICPVSSGLPIVHASKIWQNTPKANSCWTPSRLPWPICITTLF